MKETELEVQLALINKSLEEITQIQKQQSKTLYGNGTVENSIIWLLQELNTDTKNIKTEIGKLKGTMIKLPCQLSPDYYSENRNWSDVFKKVTLKAPYILVLLLIVFLLHQPTITAIAKIISYFS